MATSRRDSLYKNGQAPGPGEYNSVNQETVRSRTPNGKFSRSTKDFYMKVTEFAPGPGQYKAKEHLNKTGGFSFKRDEFDRRQSDNDVGPG